MTSAPFESSAQNAEDVVLWRALHDVGAGRYVDVGANEPVVDSITWAFYTRGWRGITAEPVPALVAAHRAQRPDDVQVEAVIGALDTGEVVLHSIPGTGLSTISDDVAARHAGSGWQVEDHKVAVRRLDDVLADAGWDDGRDIHLLTVDTEGSEKAVLESIDLRRFRPWVLVVEATAPNSAEQRHGEWEHLVLAADYVCCLFDGLSRFYVAAEHAERLAPALSYPACALDTYTTLSARRAADELAAATAQLSGVRAELAQAQARAADLLAEAVRWRTAAVTRWSAALGGAAAASANSELGVLRHEVEAMRRTVSWRVTRPLRAVRTRAGTLRELL